MMSSRTMNTNASTMAPTTDADFSFGPMLPYVGFDAAGMGMGMGLPGVERTTLLAPQHNDLYETCFDLSAAAGLPFQQEPGLLPPASLPPPSMAMPMLPLPGVAAAEVYPFGGGVVGLGGGFLKREDGGCPIVVDGASGGGGRIGLNLGRRTYFSPADVLAVDRLLLTRSRLGVGGVLGLGLGAAAHLHGHHHHHQPPRCQAEGCKADLSSAKHYHRRHKVCEHHAKAATVAAAGKQQRFCQQCSRFHVLAEFDEAKRSCRKRLTEHNRRRRKPAGPQDEEDSSLPPPKKADTTSYNGDHKSATKAAAAKSTTAISPNGSCLDVTDNGQASSAAAAPTALSLAALMPVHEKHAADDDGGLDSMLTQRVRARDADEEHRHYMTSLVMQSAQQHHNNNNNVGDEGHGGGATGGGNILSCSSVSDQQDGGCNGFFEVDFI